MKRIFLHYRASKATVFHLWFIYSILMFSGSSFAGHAVVTLTQQEKNFLQQHPQITLGTDESWEPYVVINSDGSISGYDAGMLKKINQLTGANFTLTLGTWADMQLKAKTKEIDGLSTGAAIFERTSYLNFSSPYLTLQKSLFVSTGNPLSIKNHQDLKGKTLVIQKGNMADSELAKKFTHSKILYVDTVEELFSSISTGKADATFGNGATLYLANKLGMPYVQVAFHLPQQLELVFGIRKDWPEAVSILNKGLLLLDAHEKVQLQTKWFSGQTTPAATKGSSPLTLSESERTLISNTSALRLCVDPNWLPYTAINAKGEYQGVTADILRLINQRLDTQFTLIPSTDWSESVDLMRRKECDFITAITPTTERKKFMSFTESMMTSPIVLATRQDQFFITDINNIVDKPIAVIKHSAAATLAKSVYPSLNIINVDSIQSGLKMLSEKKVFGYIDSIEVIAHHVNKEHYVNIKISSTLPVSFELSIGVRKDWPEWVPLINKALQNISEEEKKAIYNHWVGIKYDTPADYTFVWTIVAIIGVIIFLGAYRYRIITRYNTKLEALNQKLSKQAMTDQLTQLPNRYLLDQEAQRLITTSKRYQEAFSMVLFDLDYFKEINDKFGHQTGDDVLVHISHEMKETIREADILGRWGGEEFLMICPNTSIDGAYKLANKVRMHIEEQCFLDKQKITISAGVAEFTHNENYRSLLKRLDDALYDAKNAGRNTVVNSYKKDEKKPDISRVFLEKS